MARSFTFRARASSGGSRNGVRSGTGREGYCSSSGRSSEIERRSTICCAAFPAQDYSVSMPASYHIEASLGYIFVKLEGIVNDEQLIAGQRDMFNDAFF